MQRLTLKIIVGGIILLLLLPTAIGARPDSVIDNETGSVDQECSDGRSPSPRTPAWPEPELEQEYGDRFNQRAIFVHQDPSTYLDDLLFCSAIPAAVHWEGSTRFESMMISDEPIRENGNLIGDYAEYLRKLQAEPDIDFIGVADSSRKVQLASYFDNVDEVNDVTYADNVYDGSADIARFYWANQRQLGTDTAVLAYVPHPNGGTEIRNDYQGTQTGNFGIGTDIIADEVSWLKFEIEWSDPQANTDYRIGIQDEYALHPNEYNNNGQIGYTNPTNNKLYSNRGHSDVGVSPYYSYLPYKEYSYTPGYDQTSFGDELPAGDLSAYPIPGALDHKTYQFGPVKKGQWIAVVTDWTYYVNSTNETDYRDFDSFIYEPGKGPGDDFLLEASFEPLFFKGQRPEYGYCMAPEDGYYSVTLHSRPSSINGSFDTTVYWGFPEAEKTWYAQQLNSGSDPIDYNYQVYSRTSDAMTESVTNGAVIAALKNVPMMYTAGGASEYSVVQALEELNIENLVIVDPADMIEVTYWEDLGFNVEAEKSDVEVFNYIYDLAKSKGLDKSLVLNAQGGPWFSGAAFSAAYHGAPVPALDDTVIIDVLNQATITWWKTIQSDVNYMRPVFTENNTPKQRVMEAIADAFFSWLEGYNYDFNPDCNDANGDGVPDTGNSWDYSEDVDVIVVSPMNTIKPTLDRAINGKASVGRIPIADPSPLWAVLNREMLYWKVGFSQADNPEDPNDVPPANDHWQNAGWSFVSYTHDDSDPNDDDSGDSDDDDYCGFEDGGQVHKSYRPREQLPPVAESYGKTNDFHTYYPNVRAMLENGVSFWSHNAHGSHNYMMETGIGITSLGTDPSDPAWTGPGAPEDGFIDPPVDIVSGWDWYYEIDNLHSPFIVMMACQVGGSRLPEYFLRTGAVAAVGSTVIMSKKSTAMFLDRTTNGLFSGMSFGESHRWAVDECSNVYSMHDPTVNNYLYSDRGYIDALWLRTGDTVQTILHGDPDLVMISPTLWLDVQWSYPRSGGNLTINITVRNQYGVNVRPDSIDVTLDSELLVPQEVYKGFYQLECCPSSTDTDHNLEVEISSVGYVSSKGDSLISREYDLVVPKVQLDFGNVNYTGGFVQMVDIEAHASLPQPFATGLNYENANYIRAYIYDNEDIYTGLEADLNYINTDLWQLNGLNVSALPEGEYYIVIIASAFYRPFYSCKSGNFTVVHRLYFEEGNISFNETYKILDISNISIYSTYSGDGKLSPDELINITYEIFKYESGVNDEATGVTGSLDYDEITTTFQKPALNLAKLALGTYYVQISAATDYGDIWTMTTPYFTIDQPVCIFGPELDYIDGFTQELKLYDIRICNSLNTLELVDTENIIGARYSIYHTDGTLTDLKDDLIFSDNSWEVKLNVSSLDEGSYYAKITVMTMDYGSNNRTSESFDITHQLLANQPTVEYNRSSQTVKISDLIVRSSFGEAYEVDDGQTSEHTYEIYSALDNSSTNISGQLEYSGSGWGAECSSDTLGDGDYYITCIIGYKSKKVEVYTTVFSVRYDLHVNRPEVEFSRADDTIRVYNITPYSDSPVIGYLTPETAAVMQVTIYNESGSAVMSALLEFNGTSFYKIFYNISEVLEKGQYYAVVKANLYSEEASSVSEPFNITFRTKAKDDDGEDMLGPEGALWWVLAVIIIVIIVIATFVFFIFKSRQEEEDVIIKWDDEEEDEKIY